eukprot:6501625-Pyramimonas_sp.AAC.1
MGALRGGADGARARAIGAGAGQGGRGGALERPRAPAQRPARQQGGEEAAAIGQRGGRHAHQGNFKDSARWLSPC